eukprot:scaffold4738_cov61-Cyclotella_meneghiniana.AAC.7
MSNDPNDFTSWPDPPPSYQPHLQWDHPSWNKVGNNQYLYTRSRGILRMLMRLVYDQRQVHQHSQVTKSEVDYTPLSLENDEQLREEWRTRMIRERFDDQYCDRYEVLERMFPSNGPNVKSEDNQYYINAVKTNRPDLINGLFAKGTSEICPNCLERFDDERCMRRGVVYYAMEHLYDENKSREDAFECLQLVCSLDGVDVNADTWYTPFHEGPPLHTAMHNLDVEAMKILLESGASTTYQDVLSMNGQWCRLLKPFECADEKYSTALHVLIEKMQDDILVRVDYEVNESGLTALEVLATFIDSYKQLYPEDDDPPSYPISTGLIQKAQLEVKAKVNDNQSSSYTAIISSAELANNKWDTIESLDSTMRTYSGFAKTLPDVVDAFKFIVAQHQQDDIDTLEYEFIYLGDSEQLVIPLVRCPVTENVESFSFDEYLHPGGVKHFDLTVLGDPPRGSSRKKLLKISIVLMLGCNKTVPSDMVAACIWFQDVKPSKDINFNHFWYTEELSNDFNDFGGSYDIWLNPEMANPACFYSNDRTSWVVSKFKTSMFSVS